MKRIGFIVALVFTCVLTAVANLVIDRVIGINFFSLSFWFVIPAGALIVGASAASGGVLAARYLHLRLGIFEALLMAVAAAFAMWLIYFLDYLTLVLPDGRRAIELVDFGKYVDLVVTNAHMRVGRGARDAGKVGELGYWLLVIQFIGFLVGGFATFLFGLNMPRCSQCGSYFRKLKTRLTPDMTLEEGEKMLEWLRRGDISNYQKVIGWVSDRKLKTNSPVAKLKFDLLGCPKCKTEVLESNVLVLAKGEWKTVSDLRDMRLVGEGLSLREAFDVKRV